MLATTLFKQTTDKHFSDYRELTRLILWPRVGLLAGSFCFRELWPSYHLFIFNLHSFGFTLDPSNNTTPKTSLTTFTNLFFLFLGMFAVTVLKPIYTNTRCSSLPSAFAVLAFCLSGKGGDGAGGGGNLSSIRSILRGSIFLPLCGWVGWCSLSGWGLGAHNVRLWEPEGLGERF